jgi:hypothetical protein
VVLLRCNIRFSVTLAVAIMTEVFFAMTLPAQNVLPFQHISVNSGLSQSTVYSILEDSRGYMWFATGDGLNRFDGRNFVVYKSKFNDTIGGHLGNRNINSRMCEDSYHRLWVVTDLGLSFLDYRTGKFSIQIGVNDMESAGYLSGLDSDGILWVLVDQKGLYEVNTKTLKYVVHLLPDTLPCCYHQSNAPSNTVISKEGVWLIDYSGLLFFDKKKEQYRRVISNSHLTSAFMLYDGRLLLSSTNGVYLYTIGRKMEFIPITKPGGHEDHLWQNIAEDQVSHLVYLTSSTSNQICAVDLSSRKSTFYTAPQAGIDYLFIDRSENL